MKLATYGPFTDKFKTKVEKKQKPGVCGTGEGAYFV